MNQRDKSLRRSLSGFSFPSYFKSVRRAVLAAETVRDRRLLRTTAFIRAVKGLVPSGVRSSRAVQFGLRHLDLRTAPWTISFLRTISEQLFKQRRSIRALFTRIIDQRSDAADWAQARYMLALTQRLIDQQIPFVSLRVLRLINFVLVAMLSAQMASGNAGNTITLARILNLTFRGHIRQKRSITAFVYFKALLHTRQYERIAREFTLDDPIDNHYLAHIVGVGNLYSDRPEMALHFLNRAYEINSGSHADYRMLGRTHLLLGNIAEAAMWFKRAVALAPSTVMAHHNYAGRYDIQNYKPVEWELRRAGALMVYDNFGQVAEDFFLLGKFEASFRCYQQMLNFQKRWKRQNPLPSSLRAELARTHANYDPGKPIRLLPYEWVTQFGHIGLLDSYLKMARLGMYPDANYVLLAPEDKVVNPHYLTYWDDHFTIVRDRAMIDALFPFQRILGDNFMAYPATGGVAEPWTRAAARAQSRWAEEQRPPLLKISASDQDAGERALAALGVPKGAWYVGIHVREGGYYGESTGGISTHRNSRIEDYLPAIREITTRGGYVIRLGDKSMRPIDKMDGLVDYALSDSKSPELDIFFCATSRFVIGTTSGLTTACLSFGTPMVLVNCISNDWQLWSSDTDFILKPVYDVRAKRTLPLAETFSMPVQGYLINSQVMRRKGLVAAANSEDEIRDAIRFKLDLMDGVIDRDAVDAHPVMRRYRAAMEHNPFMFAAARPALPFLESHPELLAHALADDQPGRAFAPAYDTV